MSPSASFPSSPFPFLNLPSDTAQTCCYPSTASTVPSGSQGASPYLVSSCLWLKQGGQSPLDPKGAPISRDVSKPWVQRGTRVGLMEEGDDGRCCSWRQEGLEEAESIFSSPVVLTYGSPGHFPHHSVFSIRKWSSRAVTTPARVRPRLPMTRASNRVLPTPSSRALA